MLPPTISYCPYAPSASDGFTPRSTGYGRGRPTMPHGCASSSSMSIQIQTGYIGRTQLCGCRSPTLGSQPRTAYRSRYRRLSCYTRPMSERRKMRLTSERRFPIYRPLLRPGCCRRLTSRHRAIRGWHTCAPTVSRTKPSQPLSFRELNLRNCLKSPNRLQIDALRVDNTGQKHHFLLVTAPKLPLRLCSQLLIRQFLEEVFSDSF